MTDNGEQFQSLVPWEGDYFPTVVPVDGPHDWIPYEQRDSEQRYLTDEFHASIGDWAGQGLAFGELPSEVIYEQDQLDVLGAKLLRVYQTSGSCVGAGALSAFMAAIIGDIKLRNDMEDWSIPFHLAAYGVGRKIGGMRGRGEGSFGGAQAKAMAQFGYVYHADVPGLPQPTVRDGWFWYDKGTELTWSHPSAWPSDIDQTALEAVSRKQVAGEYRRLRSAADVKQAMAMRCGVTIACSFGTRGCRVVDGVLLAEWDSSWAHQQSGGGYKDHQSLGTIYKVDNQWKDAHGRCPIIWGQYGAYGSYWVRESVMERMCATGEVYAFTRTTGRAMRPFTWENLGIKLAA